MYLLCSNNWCISCEWEVNSWIRNQVCLKLSEIHIESSVKPKGGSDGGDNLPDEPVQVGVGRSLDVQVPPADVVDGLVVHHEGAVRVLQGIVRGQHRVVGLHTAAKQGFYFLFIARLVFIHLTEMHLWTLAEPGKHKTQA